MWVRCVNLYTADGAKENAACYGGGGGADSALGDSVLSTDDMSDATMKHRGYSGDDDDDDDDDDDAIPDVMNEFQVADVSGYFRSLQTQYQRMFGKTVSRLQQSISFFSCFAYPLQMSVTSLFFSV